MYSPGADVAAATELLTTSATAHRFFTGHHVSKFLRWANGDDPKCRNRNGSRRCWPAEIMHYGSHRIFAGIRGIKASIKNHMRG
jgi:hypothetical protein